MKKDEKELSPPLTEERLEDILSCSEIKAQFFNLGYGLFNVYLNAYRKYGKLSYPYDPNDTLYKNFMEVEEDIAYIHETNGGRAILDYWFYKNRDYIGERIFGKKHKQIRQIEKRLIDDYMLKDFVYDELVPEYLEFFGVLSGGANMDSENKKKTALRAYEKALYSVYNLYIKNAMN